MPGAVSLPVDTDGTHECPKCGAQVANERFLLIGTLLCPACTPQRPRLKGVMEYEGKTAGVLIVTENEELFKALKLPANRRR